MSYSDTKQIFIAAVQAAGVGTTRLIRDGGTEDGKTFILEQRDVEGVAENLATWWDEKYSDTTVTPEMASDYLDEVYPIA